MDALLAGFERFRDGYFKTHRAVFTDLATKGQRPRILIIGCSDSRVDPGLIFDTGPGEMFVIRNVANLVPPFETGGSYHGTSAAIEFAVRSLEVSHVAVLGHAGCGGVRALVDGDAAECGDFVRSWMDIARTARDRALALTLSAGAPPEAALRMAEQETVAISMANLMTFPWLRERVLDGRLTLHGLYFDVELGDLFRLDGRTNTFTQV
jgi:carbonic anhydrase